MKLVKFWDEAIESFCYKNTSLNSVFISISEESLAAIKNEYIESGSLNAQDIELVHKNIHNAGGVIESYYQTIIQIHHDLGSPARFSFLRFSILVIGAFRQDNSSLRNYWIEVDPFLMTKNISVINGNERTQYVNDLIIKLTERCYKEKEKTFFQLNIFGDNTSLVNVGRIKAHSVFKVSDLVKIRKSIYNLGYSNSHNIEDFTFDDVKAILEDSELVRVLKLFNREDDAKEMVFACMKIWLNKWVPSQEEKVQLLDGKLPTKNAKLSIHRLWDLHSETSNIEIKFGFIYKSELGEDSKYYLNIEDDVFVDTTWGIKLSDDRNLYVINNYKWESDLDDNELGLSFNKINPEISESNYALEYIDFKKMFIEHFKKKILIKPKRPFVLATKNIVERGDGLELFLPKKNNGSPQDKFDLWRVRDSLSHNGIKFITTDDIAISIIGISDGRRGLKSFESSYPIKLNIGSASKGEIHLIFKEKLTPFSLSRLDNCLSTEIELGLLEAGTYSIKYFLNNKYLNFVNGSDTIEFEIVNSGVGDRRIELKKPTVELFKYHEFERFKQHKSFEKDIVIFHENKTELDLNNQHLDFYFTKDDEGFWIDISDQRVAGLRRRLKNHKIFLQRTVVKPATPQYSNWKIDLVYLDTQFNEYKYSINCCSSNENLRLTFDIKDFSIQHEDNKIIRDYVKASRYCYKLIEMDAGLKDKYPNVCVGDELYLLSNTRERNSDKLLKIINQDFFPFKKE